MMTLSMLMLVGMAFSLLCTSVLISACIVHGSHDSMLDNEITIPIQREKQQKYSPHAATNV